MDGLGLSHVDLASTSNYIFELPKERREWFKICTFIPTFCFSTTCWCEYEGIITAWQIKSNPHFGALAAPLKTLLLLSHPDKGGKKSCPEIWCHSLRRISSGFPAGCGCLKYSKKSNWELPGTIPLTLGLSMTKCVRARGLTQLQGIEVLMLLFHQILKAIRM